MKEQNFNWEDISPLEYIEGHRKAQQKDIEFLADRINQFVTVLCPACNGNDFGWHMPRRTIAAKLLFDQIH